MLTARHIVLFLMGIGLLAETGCIGASDARTSNQGGGNLLSAASKLMEGNIGGLTPDEWQILGDNVPKLAAQYGIKGINLPVLSDDQAAAIVDFLAAYQISTIDDLVNAIDSGAIGEDDIPPELLELF